MSVVSFKGFELEPRFDGKQWTSLRIFESNSKDGPWSLIDTIQITHATDPSDPEPLDFSTENATLAPGAAWYYIEISDADGDRSGYEPRFNPNVDDVEILASTDDVNGNLDGEVIEATPDNTALIQLSVARVVRGYLAALVDAATLMAWDSPEATPDIIREIAAKLIAAQLYFVMAARQSFMIDDHNYGQRLYDEAMKMLQGIIDGTIPLPPDIVPPGEGTMNMSGLDFFPVDATDRAFSMGMLI